jgi:hypothetical protein
LKKRIEVRMDRQAIEQAIEGLRGAGEPISARRIRRLLVAQYGQGPSYRDIYQHLRDTGRLVVGEEASASEEVDEEADDDRQPHVDTVVNPDDGVRVFSTAEEASAEPPDDEDEADELPPAAQLIADAEAALQQARDRVATLEAERPTLAPLIDDAREAVLRAVQRQLAAKEALWRSHWPREDAPVLQALEAEVAARAATYRQARQAAAQLERLLTAARQQVYEAGRALEEVRREALRREHAPELWRRLQRAIRARNADPLVTGPTRYDYPGASIKAKARHQQAIEALEAAIADVLAGAGVA